MSKILDHVISFLIIVGLVVAIATLLDLRRIMIKETTIPAQFKSNR